MKKLLLILSILAVQAPVASAAPYLRVGLNKMTGSMFWPIAGAEHDRQIGVVTSLVEHRSEDGYLVIPGISFSLLDLGYIGDVRSAKQFVDGKLAFGPSIQAGELVKSWLRWSATLLPMYENTDSYGALKALIAEGQNGMYFDVGLYEATPLKGFFPLGHIQFETMLGASLVKRW